MFDIPKLWLKYVVTAPQALSLIEQEKSTMAEKLANTQRDLHDTALDLDRARMEAATKAEQDKSRQAICPVLYSQPSCLSVYLEEFQHLGYSIAMFDVATYATD